MQTEKRRLGKSGLAQGMHRYVLACRRSSWR